MDKVIDPTTEQARLQFIKTRMPGVYEHIRSEAKTRGNGVFALVRKGLRGEPNCFYAVESGHVVGTPFNEGVEQVAAQLMVAFQTNFVCMLARGDHAAH